MPPAATRTIGTVCAVFAALITVVIFLTRPFSKPNPARIFGMDMCEGRACFRGLVPGETSWEDAKAMFNGRVDISIDGPYGAIRLFETADGTTLRRIYITLPDGSLSVGSVMLLYGRPCAVTVYPQFRKFTLRYPAVSFVAHFHQARLTPDTPIVSVDFVGSALHERSPSGICSEQQTPANVEAHHFRWKGFGGIGRYTA
jgi:hypothetical protein